ncbi:methyltransferase domain-containing protein [Aliidiomarina sp. Khilg15.8]
MPVEYDKNRVARHFGRAASHYNRYNQLQRAVAEALIMHLQPAASLLDAGCGPGINVGQLTPYTDEYLGLDLSLGMLQRARADHPEQAFIQGDLEQLPLPTNCVNGLFSSLSVQWCNAPQSFLSEAARVVKPGGQVLFSTVLENSLQPLSRCWQQIDGHAHSNPQHSLRDWEELIAAQPGLYADYIAQRRFTVFGATVAHLLQGIRGVGANYHANAITPRFSRHTLQQLGQLYDSYREARGLPLHYEIGLFILRRKSD